MCVGNTMQEMMKPKVISNPAQSAPPPLTPPPVPIAQPRMSDSESKSTDQSAPSLAIKKKAKGGNPLRIDLAGTGAGGGSGLNVPL